VGLRALIFDFDGLLVDTEMSALRAWQEVLLDYGVTLPLDVWHAAVGGQSSVTTALTYLESRIGPYDREPVVTRWRAVNLALATQQPLREGVAGLLAEAAAQGLRLAVASGATGDWVAMQLRRVGVHRLFDVVSTVDGKRPKPAPDVYLAALDSLGLAPDEAIAFEDSPTGVAAAKAAGLRCVAVPNEVTAALTFADADLVVPSLAVPLADLLDHTRFTPSNDM
jgi:HAD superfamily hydrolase (TIGR01509 family)